MSVLATAASLRRATALPPATGIALTGLALVMAGMALPWVTVYKGLAPIPGFLLDGGPLAGLALAASGLIAAAVRLGGGLGLRVAAFGVSVAVAADAVFSAWRIQGFVADPGPAGALTQPTAGPGAVVMAIGGLLLAGAAVAARPRDGGLSRPDALRLVLGGALLLSGWTHLLLGPEHVAESAPLGAGFILAGAAQVLLAGLVLLRPSDIALLATVGMTAGLLALYAWAVAVGLPGALGGHDAHEAQSGMRLLAGEPVDLAGIVNAMAEVAAIAIASTTLGGRRAGAGPTSA